MTGTLPGVSFLRYAYDYIALCIMMMCYYDETPRCPADGYLQWARFEKNRQNVRIKVSTYRVHNPRMSRPRVFRPQHPRLYKRRLWRRRFCDENTEAAGKQGTTSLEACEPVRTRATRALIVSRTYEYKFMQIGRPRFLCAF